MATLAECRFELNRLTLKANFPLSPRVRIMELATGPIILYKDELSNQIDRDTELKSARQELDRLTGKAGALEFLRAQPGLPYYHPRFGVMVSGQKAWADIMRRIDEHYANSAPVPFEE